MFYSLDGVEIREGIFGDLLINMKSYEYWKHIKLSIITYKAASILMVTKQLLQKWRKGLEFVCKNRNRNALWSFCVPDAFATLKARTYLLFLRRKLIRRKWVLQSLFHMIHHLLRTVFLASSICNGVPRTPNTNGVTRFCSPLISNSLELRWLAEPRTPLFGCSSLF